MGTFLLFLLVFGFFGWGMWKLLRFTRDTVGENSPLKVSRVYEISEFKYFTGFDGIMAAFSILMGVVLFFQISRMPLPANQNYSLLLYFALFLTPLLIMGLGFLSFALQINHWPYVRGVVIRTNPAHHSLEITFHNKILIVQDGDIVKIEGVYSKSRMGYSYSTYYLNNGKSFILSGRMPGQEVIQEYFPKITFSGRYTQFGFIKNELLP